MWSTLASSLGLALHVLGRKPCGLALQEIPVLTRPDEIGPLLFSPSSPSSTEAHRQSEDQEPERD